MPLFEKAGVASNIDEGFLPLKVAKDCDKFVTASRKLRFWERKDAER